MGGQGTSGLALVAGLVEWNIPQGPLETSHAHLCIELAPLPPPLAVHAGSPADAPRPSLIVCPSTLVAHWAYEVAKFVGGQPGALRPLQYAGNPGERAALRQQLATHDVVVMAYESLRAGGAVGLGGGAALYRCQRLPAVCA